jgi:type VI secretion system protein ImpK
MTPSANTRRPDNLALIYQEALTAIERLRANTQGVNDANAFRHHTREAMKTAANQALAAGYNADDTKYATFAAVAFLDESVLNSQNPIFADWLRKPLQEELFGTHIAGEGFFQNLQQLVGRSDSHDLADLLEVHYLCLLLGFCGKYRAGNRGELDQTMNMTRDKIHRIRGRFSQLSPAWMLPPGTIRSSVDPWVRKLGIVAAVAAIVMVLLFVGYKIGLSSGVSDVRSLAPQTRS